MRTVKEVTPAVYMVQPDGAMFGDPLDAKAWAAMRDVIDDPTDTAARFRLGDAADLILGAQHIASGPKGKRTRS